MSERVGTSTQPAKDPMRTVLRFGLAAGAAAFGARSISTALTRAWIGTKAVDNAAGALGKSVR